MKKVFVLVMVAIMTLGMSFKAQAIENPWNEGTFVVNAHAGFFPGIGGSVSGDYVFINSWWKGHFTIGGYAGFNNRNFSNNGATTKTEVFSVMPRATYGLNITKDFEVHVGVMTGVCLDHTRTNVIYLTQPYTETYTFDYVYVPFFGGCRYNFTPYFGVSAEVCFSNNSYISYLNAGITFKF